VGSTPARRPTTSGLWTAESNTALDATGCAGPPDNSNAFRVGYGLTGAVDEVEVARFPLSATQVAKFAGANQLTVDATDLRAHTRSTEFGLMLEDISHSVDGGLYAELVRNRTFKEPWQGTEGSGPVQYWSLVRDGGGPAASRSTRRPLRTRLWAAR
jgi:hypothetical protein